MEMSATRAQDVYEIRPRADHDGVDLISDALRFGSLWYAGPNAVSNAIGFAKFYSRSNDAVIRVYDQTGKSVIASVIRDISVQRINQGFLSCCCFNQSEGLTRL